MRTCCCTQANIIVCSLIPTTLSECGSSGENDQSDPTLQRLPPLPHQMLKSVHAFTYACKGSRVLEGPQSGEARSSRQGAENRQRTKLCKIVDWCMSPWAQVIHGKLSHFSLAGRPLCYIGVQGFGNTDTLRVSSLLTLQALQIWSQPRHYVEMQSSGCMQVLLIFLSFSYRLPA